MSMSNTEIQYALTLNTEQFNKSLRQLEITLFRLLSYIERMTGGNPELAFLINKVQEAITALRSLQVTVAAVAAATGPVGVAYAGVSILTTALAFADFADMSEGY